MKMGMPEQDAHNYQHELDAGRVIVVLNADERPEQAFSIMRQMGAFDISSHMRTAAANVPRGRMRLIPMRLREPTTGTCHKEAYNPNLPQEAHILILTRRRERPILIPTRRKERLIPMWHLPSIIRMHLREHTILTSRQIRLVGHKKVYSW